MSSIEESEPSSNVREVGEIIEEEDYCARCLKISFWHVKGDKCINQSDKIANNSLICEHCNIYLRSFYKLKKHYKKYHCMEYPINKVLLQLTRGRSNVKKSRINLDEIMLDYQQTNNYSTKIGVIDELKINKPSNLNTYTKKKIPIQIIKEDPEFVVSESD